MLARINKLTITPVVTDDDGEIKTPSKGQVVFSFDPESEDGQQFITKITGMLSREYVELDVDLTQLTLSKG